MSLNQIFSLDPGSVLWTILSFVTLLLILSKVAWKPILSALEAREQGIRDDIAGARSDREEAARIRADFEARLSEARQEAQGILSESRERAKRFEADEQRRLQEELNQQRERAAREIELQGRQAMDGLKGEVSALVLAAAEQVLRKGLQAADHEAVIRDALSELESGR
jgi:F-type H+-transporting ATPase subunit b